jgi:hypothetical protein
MELAEPDESGRRSPILVRGSDFEIEADQIIIAIGQGWIKKKSLMNLNIPIERHLPERMSLPFSGEWISKGILIRFLMGRGLNPENWFDLEWLSKTLDKISTCGIFSKLAKLRFYTQNLGGDLI